MTEWKSQIIVVKGCNVKVYINASNTKAYVFTSFGRYYGLSSDVNALDFAVSFLFGRRYFTGAFAAYQSGTEETGIIYLDKVA